MRLDDVIGWISPKWAAERQAWRAYGDSLDGLQKRGYAAADRGRRNADWRVSWGSADREGLFDLNLLRARHRQMIRDNKYARSALVNMTAQLVGTGIEGRPIHDDDNVRALAKGIWDEHCAGTLDVEGRHDSAGLQAIAAREMIEGGDVLRIWRSKGRLPDAEVVLIEAEQIDSYQTRNLWETGGRIIQGVEYDKDGRRVAVHVLDHHPGDQVAWMGSTSTRYPIADVDHLFETVRVGQSRGVPWFHAGVVDLREVAGTEDAIRMKRRIEACLSVFRKAGDGAAPSPLGQQTAQPAGPAWERISPGMVVQGKPGESIEVIQPSAAGDGDQFNRQQLMAIAASFGLPYDIMTGDVSQANYSSIRASRVTFWALLDCWVFLTLVPQYCAPEFRRVMRREAIRRQKPELLQVRAEWTPPKRPWVDPLKDVAAELVAVRSGFSGLPEALAARGMDLRDALNEYAQVNALIDKLGLVLDSDPRRVNTLGAIQPPAGYLKTATDQANSGQP